MKTQRYKRTLMFMTLLLSVMMLTSCHYKYFDDYEGFLKVKVVLDYSHMDTTDAKPKVMKVVFYPTDKSFQPVSYNIKDSAYVDVPVASYRVFTYNDDSEINRAGGVDDTSSVPLIYTGRANYRGLFPKDSLDNTLYYDFPDRLFTDCKLASVSGDIYTTQPDDNRIVLYPEERTRRVEVVADGLKNLKYVNGVRISLDGIQHEYVPNLWSYTNTYVPLVSDASKDDDRNRIESYLYSFGFNEGKHYLQIFLQGNGFNRILRFDVTEQVIRQLNNSDTMKIYVNAVYDAYDDVPVNVSSGFNIGVDDWYNNDVPLNM